MATKKKAKKSTKAKGAKKRAVGAKSARAGLARQTAKKGAKKATRVAAKKAASGRRGAATTRGAAKKSVKKAAPRKAPSKAGVRKAAPAVAVARAKPLMRREDRPGHLDPRYVADLRAQADPSPQDPTSFLERPRSRDDLVEELGEEYVASATTGEYEAEDAQNQDVPEEVGGPFVETTDRQEFAPGVDASNPKGATREPFPRT